MARKLTKVQFISSFFLKLVHCQYVTHMCLFFSFALQLFKWKRKQIIKHVNDFIFFKLWNF